MTEITYTLGLDLGAARDPSACGIVEHKGQGRSARHRVAYLHRWPLGTGYPRVVRDVQALFRRPPLSGQTLALDATGVGAAVRDMLAQAGIDGHVAPYVITAGWHSGKGTVCKADLIAALQAALGEGRLKVADLELAPALRQELEGWRVEYGSTGQVRYDIARDGQGHGDLCVAVGLALHHAERQRRLGLPRFLSFRRPAARKPPRLIVVPRDVLADVEVELNDVALLVSVSDPGQAPAVPEELPFDCPPSGRLHLQFADLTPEEANHDYFAPVEPWGRPADRLVMHRQEHGKQLWRFLLKKFDPAPNVIVFADGGNGDRRALSLAYAVADVRRWPRQTQVFCPADPEARHDGAPAPNAHVYETARQGRLMVIG